MTTEIQSILFKKDGIYDTPEKRNAWLKEHKLKLLKGKKVDTTEKYWRYRITPPRATYEKRVQRFSKNVDAIIQYPKTTEAKKKELVKRESERDVLESQLLKKRDEGILRLQKEKAQKEKLLEDRELMRQLKIYRDLVKETEEKAKRVVSSSGNVEEIRAGIISTIVPYNNDN
jgi:hypothetical protein